MYCCVSGFKCAYLDKISKELYRNAEGQSHTGTGEDMLTSPPQKSWRQIWRLLSWISLELPTSSAACPSLGRNNPLGDLIGWDSVLHTNLSVLGISCSHTATINLSTPPQFRISNLVCWRGWVRWVKRQHRNKECSAFEPESECVFQSHILLHITGES